DSPAELLHDSLYDRQADSRALVVRVLPAKGLEYPGGGVWRDSDAIIRHFDSRDLSFDAAVDPNPGFDAGKHELRRVVQEVRKTLREQRVIAAHVRPGALHLAIRLVRLELSVRMQDVAQLLAQVAGAQFGLAASQLAVAQDADDELVHPRHRRLDAGHVVLP